MSGLSSFYFLQQTQPRYRSGARPVLTSSHHPQTDGKCEFQNGLFKKGLRLIGLDQGIENPTKELQWYSFLDLLAFISNITPRPDTGLAPWTIRFLTNPPDITS